MDLPLDSFLRATLLGLSVAMPVGPMALIVVSAALAGARGRAIAFGLGIATTDAGYAVVVALGLGGIGAWLQRWSAWLQVAGALMLLWVAWRILARRPDAAGDEATAKRERSFAGALRAYAAGGALTAVNPPTLALFAALFAAGGFAGMGQGAATVAAFAGGIFAGSAGWWVALAACCALLGSRLGPGAFAWINRVAGAILLALAAFGLWQGVAAIQLSG